MNRDPSDTNTNLPPWLRDQPLPPRPQSAAAPASPAPQWQAAPPLSNPSTEDAVPDWLRESAAAPAPQPQEDAVPDWLRESAAAPQPQPQEDAVPDWLRESAAAPQPQPQEDAVPDWLRESAAAPAPQPQEDAVPDWLRESAAAPQPQPQEDAVPDWLRAMAEDPGADDSATIIQPQNALDDFSSSTVVLPETPEEPRWEAPAPPSNDTSRATEKLDINDWLNDIPMDDVKAAMEGTDDEPSVQPFSFDGMGGSNTPAAPSGPPSWLGSDEAETSADWFGSVGQPTAPQPSQPKELSDDDAPSWLSQAATEAPTTPPDSQPRATNIEENRSQPATAGGGDDLPPWLQESITDAEESPLLASGGDTPSWLQEAPQPQADADVPSWLQAEPPSEPAQDENIPSWLQAEPAAEPKSEESVPSWLQAAPPTEPATDENIPSWLQASETAIPIEEPSSWGGLAQPAPTAPTSQPAQPKGNEVPDWLREAESSAPQAMDDALPAWMRGVQAEPVAPKQPAPEPKRQEPPPAPPEIPGPGGQELPPWLRDESGAPMPSASNPGEQDLPPWLKGATLDPEIENTLAAQAQPTFDAPPAEPAEAAPAIGGWFDEPEAAAAPEEPDNAFLGGADLPAWLRQPDQKAATDKERDKAESKALDWLTKLGSTEEEDAAPQPQVIATTRFAPPPSPVKTDSQIQAIALLERIARDPQPIRSAAQDEATPAAARSLISVDRLLYLLLIALLLAGALVPALTNQLQVPSADAKALALHEQISTLGPNDVVLIGYDWDARRVAELRPLEDSVIGQLIEQKVKLVLVSTDPQGSLLLYDLRDKLNAAQYRPSGIDYLLLGYQPGGELALRSLAQNFGNTLNADFQGEDMTTSPLALGTSTGTNKPLASLKDFSTIILFADDQADIQSWMEQIYQAAPDVPFVTLMTAEAAPASEPYQRQPHVFGLVGTPGALDYAALRGDAQGASAIETGQLRLGMLTFVVLLIFGIILAAIVDATRRRRA